MSPQQVSKIEESFKGIVDKPVELIVRSILSKDVSATGTASQIVKRNLDGFFLNQKLKANIRLISKKRVCLVWLEINVLFLMGICQKLEQQTPLSSRFIDSKPNWFCSNQNASCLENFTTSICHRICLGSIQ